MALPKGCYIQLEKKVSSIILNNIRKSFGDRMGLISRIQTFTQDSGLDLTISNFIKYYRLKLSTIYARYSWTRLCADAGVIPVPSEPLEDLITKALPRIIAIDSRRWIEFILRTLPSIGTLNISSLSPLEKRMLNMFYVTIWQEAVEDWNDTKVRNNLQDLAASKMMVKEIIDILKIKYDEVDIIDKPVDAGFDCPLDLYCTYTRDQILVAMDFYKPGTVREGVKYLPDKKIDIWN